MSSSWGKNLIVSVFGESHGPAVGVVLDGLPPGIPIDLGELHRFLVRRSPGRGGLSSARREADVPLVQSGLYRGRTTGTPLAALIGNADARPGDYEATLARPSHADHTGYLRYGGFADPRGGGHFSGRLTAPLALAGGIALQILARRDIAVGAHIAAIHGVTDIPFDPASLAREDLRALAAKAFPALDDEKAAAMQAEIAAAKKAGDSVGGVIECAAVGVPAGLGSPLFDGVENKAASLLFAIPAVRGAEFGAGFAAAEMTGSAHNDPYRMKDGKIVTATNRHGGALGGVTSGMPLVVRVALKPTPSIASAQQTVDYIARAEAEITVAGRHDPCVVPRAVPVVEACLALAILDLALEGGNPNGFSVSAR